MRLQFELTELRISAHPDMEITTKDASPKRPIQMGAGGTGRAGGERLLAPTVNRCLVKTSRVSQRCSLLHFKVPLKRVRRRSAPRGIGDQTPVDIRRGCVFTRWCLFEVNDQEAAGRLPSLCVAPGNSAELLHLMLAEKLPHSLDLVSP